MSKSFWDNENASDDAEALAIRMEDYRTFGAVAIILGIVVDALNLLVHVV